MQKDAGKKRNHSLFKWLYSTALTHCTVAKNMKKKDKTKRSWNPHNQSNFKSDSMFQVHVFLSVYKLLQVGCIYGWQKVMQWKKLQPHCSCVSANQSAPHWLPLSDNAQAANQRMKYSHLMEWSLTQPAKRKFCWLFFLTSAFFKTFYHHQGLPCNASMVIPCTSNAVMLTCTNLHSFISLL